MSYHPHQQKIKEYGVSFSVVIETENLGMAGVEDLRDTLDSLKKQTYPITNAKEVLIIAAGHVSDETLNTLQSDYPWLVVHREDKKLEYTESKMRGAELATADIVLFADSDVVYDVTWLENILYGFVACPGTSIVSGETRIRGTSIYSKGIQLVWMMNMQYRKNHPIPTNHFHLNNFGIKRSVMLTTPFFLGLPVYRANTVEWKKQLFYKGYGAMRVPNARGYHLPPGNIADWWYRMLVFGADAVVKADFYFGYNATVIEKFSPLRRLSRIPLFIGFKIYTLIKRAFVMVREKPHSIVTVVASIPVVMASLIVSIIGMCVALVRRDYIFTIATQRENEHIV
jgi:glycosyltransferase involved in cell wall biosynthesis